ncbi:MAG: RDD family protein [Agarilytica sp.]
MTSATITEFPTAPLIKRLLAFLYDLFILGALSMVYSALATVIMVFVIGDQGTGDYQPMQQGLWFQSGWVITIVGFYWLFWRRAGQTVGMRAWHLKLVDQNGHPVSHTQILRRIISGPISLAVLGLGYWWCLFDQDQRAWHDIASSTKIIETPKIKKEKK